MKFTAISDLHISDKQPKYRKDDYLSACLTKFGWILNYTKDVKAKALVMGGDIFDYPTVPRNVVSEILRMISDYSFRILVIPGQHDLRYHSKGIDNTPLGNLVASGKMELLSPKYPINISGVNFVGQGWEEKISCSGDVLVTHQMVTKKGPLWPGQSDYISAAGLLNQHKDFKCVISGDNHKPHSFVSKDKRIQINGGGVMRSGKDQTFHKPLIWVIDTDSWKFDSDKIHVNDPKNVFDFSKIALDETKEIARKEAQEKIDAFVNSFDLKEGEKTDYKTIVRRVIKDTKPNTAVINIINDIFETIGDSK